MGILNACVPQHSPKLKYFCGQSSIISCEVTSIGQPSYYFLYFGKTEEDAVAIEVTKDEFARYSEGKPIPCDD